MTVADIQAFSLSRRYDAIFIDYLQLIPSPQGRSRYDAVTDVSIRLHQMSQTTGIAVFPLSQLSRPDKDRDGRKAPNMASLRESGQIEQDADVIMLLYKEDPGIGLTAAVCSRSPKTKRARWGRSISPLTATLRPSANPSMMPRHQSRDPSRSICRLNLEIRRRKVIPGHSKAHRKEDRTCKSEMPIPGHRLPSRATRAPRNTVSKYGRGLAV